ncbi:TIGR02391 family protein [Nocardia sp. NPDC050697]|uniref:TIGR02391 family protein n=1 Tax=Nocardia sp. NPDC050697 TaxID=3155158 RepID=UPI0034051F5D
MADNYTPEYLRSVRTAVIEFRERLLEFLELHTETDPFFAQGLMPAIFPKDDVDPAALEEARRKVGEAAGKASEATDLASARVSVQGVNFPLDPIINWRFMTDPKPIVRPHHVLDCVEHVLGRLQAMIERAEARIQPAIGPTQLHPLVWGAAGKLWSIGEYRKAVAAACDAVEHHGRNLTSRFDVDGTGMWEQAFAPAPPQVNKPRLRWPGDPETHKSVKNMNSGLLKFAAGVQMTVRNDATHGQGNSEYSEQEALERLATLSLLTRWVDTCGLEEADEAGGQAQSA